MNQPLKILVTGGCGFIGSAFIRHVIEQTNDNIINLDALTYAGNPDNLSLIHDSDRYTFIHGSICNEKLLEDIFQTHQPDKIIHFAAESHVDRSIDSPSDFIETNIVGTFKLLKIFRKYHHDMSRRIKNLIFHHISTDEVFGSLGPEGFFHEDSPYKPNSPYSASKASSDHLVRAWSETYKIPCLITNTCNNYGPYQFPEKLIPLTILKILNKETIPVYGDGSNVRDWIYVNDHVKALYTVLKEGKSGDTYAIGSETEKTNLEIVHTICDTLSDIKETPKEQNRGLITFVADRPGHDFRYAIDPTRIKSTFAWNPDETFESGIKKTITWYMNNLDWVHKLKDKKHSERKGLSNG